MARQSPLEILLRTLAAFVVLPPVLALICVTALAQTAAGSGQAQMHWVYRVFSWLIVRIAGSRIEVSGRGHIEPGQAYVVVSNHESNMDPFLLMDGLPELVIRFVIKRQIMAVPLFGRALAATGNVTVERRGSSDVARLQASMARRDAAVSILFFAEGTRARDGAFREFKKGAFATAIETGLPVLPIGMAGAFHSSPPGTLLLRRGPVVLEVGAPIPVKQLKVSDRELLRDQAHEIVGGLRARARARLRAAGGDPGGKD